MSILGQQQNLTPRRKGAKVIKGYRQLGGRRFYETLYQNQITVPGFEPRFTIFFTSRYITTAKIYVVEMLSYRFDRLSLKSLRLCVLA